jgi:hypothetical protein
MGNDDPNGKKKEDEDSRKRPLAESDSLSPKADNNNNASSSELIPKNRAERQTDPGYTEKKEEKLEEENYDAVAKQHEIESHAESTLQMSTGGNECTNQNGAEKFSSTAEKDKEDDSQETVESDQHLRRGNEHEKIVVANRDDDVNGADLASEDAANDSFVEHAGTERGNVTIQDKKENFRPSEIKDDATKDKGERTNEPPDMTCTQDSNRDAMPSVSVRDDVMDVDVDQPSEDFGCTGSTTNIEVIGDKYSSDDHKIQVIENSDEEDVYEAFKRKPSNFITKRRKVSTLRIVIEGVSSISASPMLDVPSADVTDSSPPDETVTPFSTANTLSNDTTFTFDLSEVEKELEDTLTFFEQPHEDQDPLYAKFRNEERKKEIEAALQKLEQEEEAGRREIDIVVSHQLKEKQMSTEKSVEKYKLKATAEEKKELARLQESYDEKTKSNQTKIEQGMLVLRKRHAAENQKLLQQHRQQLQHRQVSQETANVEWTQLSQRLRAKQQRLIAEFAGKGEQVKQKCKADFQRESAKIMKVYEKKHQDMDANRHALFNKIHSGFQQVRQRYLKRHAQAIAAKREHLLRENKLFNNKEDDTLPPRAEPKSGSGEKEEQRPPSPIKTFADWYKDTPYEPSAAAARHKHRKAVLNQINKQLLVEIHNEGIWIMQLKSEESDKNKKKEDSEAFDEDKKYFIPWGVQARGVLESIICGETPEECGSDKFDFGESVSINGGHLRCVMTDLRTSNESAEIQRAEAVLQQELKEVAKLDNSIKELQASIASTEKGVEQIMKSMKEIDVKLAENIKDVEKTKGHYQTFRNKFARYFGPGKSTVRSDPLAPYSQLFVQSCLVQNMKMGRF